MRQLYRRILLSYCLMQDTNYVLTVALLSGVMKQPSQYHVCYVVVLCQRYQHDRYM